MATPGSLAPPDPAAGPSLRRHTSRIPKSRREAFKSFENLVALANDQERWKIGAVTRAGKQLVWRDVGEPPVLLEGLRETAEHASAGAFRAATLGFAARSGVNVFLLLFRLARTPKPFRASLVLHAIFSPDSLQFASMLGTFVGLYRFILNALPIITLRISRMPYFSEPESFDMDPVIHVEEQRDLRPMFTRTESTASSYPGSDGEGGLYMESFGRKKSALKQNSFTPIEPSAYASAETSRPASPSSESSPTAGASARRETRHARFADDSELEQTTVPPKPPPPKKDGKEPPLETAKHALRHPGHLSTSTQAAFALMREKGYIYRRWHATLAGAVAGAVAILVEKKSRRLGYAQQLFVRGLQGSYNHWSEQTGLKVPFGSVWVFALCCGQIMYGFLLRPDTIPPSYRTWIQSASVVPQDAVEINRKLIYEGRLDIEQEKRLADGLGRPWNGTASYVTAENKASMYEEIEAALNGTTLEPMASCAAIHPHHTSCLVTGVSRIYETGKWMIPMYGALHFIPMFLFKWKAFRQSPLTMLRRTTGGTLRSATFLGVFVAIYQSYICLLHFLYLLPLHPVLQQSLRRLLMSKPAWWLGGVLSGLSLLVEESRRREELAMYVLPKGLESGWKLARGEVFGVPTQRKRRGWKSDVLLCSVGMAMVMSNYQHSPQHLSGLVRRLLYQFVGPN